MITYSLTACGVLLHILFLIQDCQRVKWTQMRKYTHDLQNLNYYQLMLSSFSNRRDLHALLFSTTTKYHEHFIKVHNALEFIPDSLVAQVVLLLQSLKQCDGIQNNVYNSTSFFIRYRRVIGRIISSTLERVPLMLKEWQGNVF